MTIEEIVDGLKFTVNMFLFDASTGKTYTEPRNDMDKTTVDACKGAIELLEQARWIPVSEKRPDVGEDVLVSVDTAESGNCWVTIAYMCYDLTDNEYWFQNEEMNFDMDEVIAWMPLPDAYEGDE